MKSHTNQIAAVIMMMKKNKNMGTNMKSRILICQGEKEI